MLLSLFCLKRLGSFHFIYFFIFWFWTTNNIFQSLFYCPLHIINIFLQKKDRVFYQWKYTILLVSFIKVWKLLKQVYLGVWFYLWIGIRFSSKYMIWNFLFEKKVFKYKWHFQWYLNRIPCHWYWGIQNPTQIKSRPRLSTWCILSTVSDQWTRGETNIVYM